jgi:predicted transglutaminase-like cysteine proteinase
MFKPVVALLGLVAGLSVPSDIPRPADPFGRDTAAVNEGALVENWKRMGEQLARDEQTIRACIRQESSDCAPALQLMRFVDEARDFHGKARLGNLNRAVNLALKAAPGSWAGALATLQVRGGDCRNFSIVKYAALRQTGLAPDLVRLVIVQDRWRQQEHMVVAVFLDGHWLILDNRTHLLLEDSDLHDYVPLFVLDERGVRRYDRTPLIG